MPSSVRNEVLELIEDLEENPFLNNAIRLRGGKNDWRIYRVVYRVGPATVTITRIRPRGDVYRGLDRD